MKASEIQALLDEPAGDHNKKEKSGCAKPKPGATAGSSWDNRGARSSGVTLYRIGMTTDLSETDVVMGRGEKRLFHAIKQAVLVYNTCVTALIGDDVGAVCKAAGAGSLTRTPPT